MLTTLAVGITGGMGGGKSEACRLFRQQGAHVIEADRLARDLMNSHPAIMRRLRRQFGNHLYTADGFLDRKSMSKLLFTDDSARSQVNAIVHPVVIEEIAGRIARAKQERKVWALIVEAALIYEAGVEEMFDYVIAVTAKLENRIERITKRELLPRQEILQRMNAQMSDEEKCSRADFVIHNDGTPSELEARCLFIEKLLRGLGAPVSGGDS